MWQCSKCAEEIEEEFDACWKCGTGHDGTSMIAGEPDKLAVESISHPVAGTVVAGESTRTVVAPGPCPLEAVISHWHKLYEGLSASSRDFYASLEQALAPRKIPGAKLGRVEFHEGGFLSAKREYLRVTRGNLTFDVCAAPFGSGFFFSWWLSAQPPSAALLYLIGIVLLALAVYTVPGIFAKIIVGFGGAVALAFLVPRFHKATTRSTYYKLDAALMFQDAVGGAVRETIDAVTTSKGLRALTDEEWKPIMRGFLAQ